MISTPFLTSIVLFDTETTGLDYEKDKIIQIAAVKISMDGKIIDTFNQYLGHPEVMSGEIEINPKALAVHGISLDVLKAKANNADFVFHDFINFCKQKDRTRSYPMTAFNLSFDYQMLMGNLHAAGIMPMKHEFFFDAMELAYRMIDPTSVPNMKQETLVDYFGIEREDGDAHDALVDSIRGAHVLLKLFEMYFKGYKAEEFKEWISNPYLPEKVVFGKHKGKKWTDLGVPGYCRYMVQNVFGDKPSILKNYCLQAMKQKPEVLPFQE